MDYIFDNERPIYVQLVEKIRIEIVSGKLKSGERIPSVRELALITKVNPNTMQKALAELETKKEEQQKLADQAKAEQEEFEREFSRGCLERSLMLWDGSNLLIRDLPEEIIGTNKNDEVVKVLRKEIERI